MHERLRTMKAVYDPDNFHCGNQNIPLAGWTSPWSTLVAQARVAAILERPGLGCGREAGPVQIDLHRCGGCG
jgi:hypothetical protein